MLQPGDGFQAFRWPVFLPQQQSRLVMLVGSRRKRLANPCYIFHRQHLAEVFCSAILQRQHAHDVFDWVSNALALDVDGISSRNTSRSSADDVARHPPSDH